MPKQQYFLLNRRCLCDSCLVNIPILRTLPPQQKIVVHRGLQRKYLEDLTNILASFSTHFWTPVLSSWLFSNNTRWLLHCPCTCMSINQHFEHLLCMIFCIKLFSTNLLLVVRENTNKFSSYAFAVYHLKGSVVLLDLPFSECNFFGNKALKRIKEFY